MNPNVTLLEEFSQTLHTENFFILRVKMGSAMKTISNDSEGVKLTMNRVVLSQQNTEHSVAKPFLTLLSVI